MRVKICGITQLDQAVAITHLGATALGFICVTKSPRYIGPNQIQQIIEGLPDAAVLGRRVDRIGVFADADLTEIYQTVTLAGLTGVQLHGTESPQFCAVVRAALPGLEIIKALRVQDTDTLTQTALYQGSVDTLLLDAYHPNLLGGTGKTIDWQSLQHFHANAPWLLAGGLTPGNVLQALSQVQPSGIDLSSGVERAPGDKDLEKVTQLFEQLKLL
ncbi:MAG: phosphoribosylanthranilate isomerase [Leptolyngbyaceae bacterium]|nr:phosphoribosylanthranilate isomerase [Leptolyngbyaceae bacterium]